MLKPGAAKKVTVHLNEDTSTAGAFIHEQVFSLLFSRGVAGATVLRPEAGFGEQHRRQGHEGESERRHLPVQIQFVEEPKLVDALLPALFDLVVDGIMRAARAWDLRSLTGQLLRTRGRFQWPVHPAPEAHSVFLCRPHIRNRTGTMPINLPMGFSASRISNSRFG
jgi:uncharacterized protein